MFLADLSFAAQFQRHQAADASREVLKEITYETSHLLPLKHCLIIACMIGQEPLSATRAHKTYDIRFCFGVQIQTLENYRSLPHAADRPSKTLTRQRLIKAADHVRSTTQKQQTLNNPSNKISSQAYYFATY